LYIGCELISGQVVVLDIPQCTTRVGCFSVMTIIALERVPVVQFPHGRLIPIEELLSYATHTIFTSLQDFPIFCCTDVGMGQDPGKNATRVIMTYIEDHLLQTRHSILSPTTLPITSSSIPKHTSWPSVPSAPKLPQHSTKNS
jgi:hypothetical protein